MKNNKAYQALKELVLEYLSTNFMDIKTTCNNSDFNIHVIEELQRDEDGILSWLLGEILIERFENEKIIVFYEFDKNEVNNFVYKIGDKFIRQSWKAGSFANCVYEFVEEKEKQIIIHEWTPIKE